MSVRPDIAYDQQTGAVHIYDDAKRLLIEQKRWLGICALFILGVMGVIGAVASGDLGARGLQTLFGCLTGGVFALYRYRRVSRRIKLCEPALTLERAGLYDRWLGMGTIPWRHVSARKAQLSTSRQQEAVVLDTRPLDTWFGGMPDRVWLRHKDKIQYSDGDVAWVALSQSGGNTLGIGVDDLLWLIGQYADVAGVPHNYQPHHPLLRSLAPTLNRAGAGPGISAP